MLARNPDLQIPQEEYNINVTANHGEQLDPNETLRRYVAHAGAGRPAHLYFHVPLCAYICHFCNYVKKKAPRDSADFDASLDRWTAALVRESSWMLGAAPWLGEAQIESCYVGGGTGALLAPRHLHALMDHVRAHYQLSDDCEVSLEGNPDNFCDTRYIAEARAAGFNRFSVGVQSFDDRVTGFTNREHDVQMSRTAIANLAATGRPFNVDLMFGLPYQTPDSVTADLLEAVNAGVPTITIYRFRNAERHKMGIGNRSKWNILRVQRELHDAGLFPSLERTYEMRDRAVDVLLAHDYQASPCGWWSRPGTYPEGNIPRVSRNKWQRHDSMIAFGPGAYGWLRTRDSVLQTHNVTDISAHLNAVESGTGPFLAHGRELEGMDAMAMTLGFALKAGQPILVDRFADEFGVTLDRDPPFAEIFDELLARSLLRPLDSARGWQPTLDGEALHEEIISVYFHRRLGGYAEPVCSRTA